MKLRLSTIAFAIVLLGAGAVIGVPATDYVDRYFSSDAFCAYGCHVMESTVYKEYQESSHWNTSTGVRPSCADCHVSSNLTEAMWDHVLGTRDLFVFIFEGVRTAGDFEKIRARAADRARFTLLKNDSKTCRSCHVMEAIKPARKRGQGQHREAMEKGITCIACHYNLVHKEVEPSEAFLTAAESR